MAGNLLCRLCLEQSGELLDIFADIDEGPRINELLTHYAIIELKSNDEISTKICVNCWSKVNDFHEFRLQVQKVQESINSIVFVDNRSDINEIVLANVSCDDEPFKDQGTALPFKDEFEKVQAECPATADVIITEGDEFVPSTGSKSTRRRPQKCASSEADQSKHEDNKTFGGRKSRRLEDDDDYEEDSNEKLISSFFKLTCELCQEHHQYCANLFSHYESAHKIRGFIMCCGRKYFKIIKIAEHVMWHQNPDLFRCTKCDLDKIFPDKKRLEAHMVTHVEANANVFHCECCEKKFVKKYRFEQHKLTHLRPEEKKFMCQDCGKPYATESLLRVHVRVVHTKSYAHMCEICAKVFKSRVFFEKHQLEHMGKSLPRVQCHICNAWMKNEHTMRAHLRLHDDEGAVHKCDLCGKTGPSRSAILKHKRYVHFSERKFKCTLCEKAFKRAVSLKEHMTLHTGEVLYKCTFCTKTFNSGANMFAHKKRSHYPEWKMEKEQNSK